MKKKRERIRGVCGSEKQMCIFVEVLSNLSYGNSKVEVTVQ